MIIGLEMKFDAGHHLPDYRGKCNRPHGHTWKVKIEVRGPLNPTTGMVTDFTTLKKRVVELLDQYDHTYLNDLIKNPTCENIVLHIYNTLVNEFLVETVQVQEGDGGWARL